MCSGAQRCSYFTRSPAQPARSSARLDARAEGRVHCHTHRARVGHKVSAEHYTLLSVNEHSFDLKIPGYGIWYP